MSQDGSKTARRGPKRVPREVQDEPKRTQKGPKTAQSLFPVFKKLEFYHGKSILLVYIIDRAVHDAAIFNILGPRGPRAQGPYWPLGTQEPPDIPLLQGAMPVIRFIHYLTFPMFLKCGLPKPPQKPPNVRIPKK